MQMCLRLEVWQALMILQEFVKSTRAKIGLLAATSTHLKE